MMIEYEMKFRGDHKDIREKLQALGGQHQGSSSHRDQYYNHPCRDFRITDEAFRMREKDGTYSLTYKGPKFNVQSKSRKEIEIKLPSNEVSEVLLLLDFEPSGVVNKERETWLVKHMIVTLDRVRGLGEYVEIELIGDQDDDLDIILDKMRDLARQLGIDPDTQIAKSYLELLEVKG